MALRRLRVPPAVHCRPIAMVSAGTDSRRGNNTPFSLESQGLCGRWGCKDELVTFGFDAALRLIGESLGLVERLDADPKDVRMWA